jgi:hypothetical protein
MNKLNFNDFFETCLNDAYAVIKLSPDFPSYDQGGDIDIFCRNLEHFSNKVGAFLQNYVDESYTIRIEKKPSKIQVDLMEGKKIHFRFDLIGSQPDFKHIKIKPAFFDIVIENAILKEVEGVAIKVPKVEDECILRYIEYNEYFGQRPDKIKHTDYINRTLDNSLMSEQQFFERLYYFTEIPEQDYRSKTYYEKIVERYKLFRTLLAKAKHLFKERGLSALFKKIIQRLK